MDTDSLDTVQQDFADNLRERMESMWGSSSQGFWNRQFYREDVEFSDPLVAIKGLSTFKTLHGTLNDSFLLTNSSMQVQNPFSRPRFLVESLHLHAEPLFVAIFSIKIKRALDLFSIFCPNI
jgi:hypothetical protein